MNKETKDVVIFVARLGKGYYDSMEDGEFKLLDDGVNFVPALLAVPAAIRGSSDIPDEIEHASTEEKEEIKQVFISEFEIENDKAEKLIENVFAVIVNFWKLFENYE